MEHHFPRLSEKDRISLEDVHYGPISPGESELKLLVDVKGKDVSEIGCGGGQNTIVLNKWGGRSVGRKDSRTRTILYQQYGRGWKEKDSISLGRFRQKL
jgi:hypothetical protein